MPKLEKRIETGLNEARILILGAQVFLGLNLQSTFAPAFDRLPELSRELRLVGLGLMVIAIGLLISPAPHHRIVEEGADSTGFHGYLSLVTEIALLPFALAFGIDLGVATARVFGGPAGVAAGAGAFLLALLFWWGIEAWWRKGHGKSLRPQMGKSEGRRIMPELGKRIETVLMETRVVIPGAQALLGFQFIAILSQGFEKLPATAQAVHIASLASIAVATMLLMTPAAWHRIAEEGEDSERFEKLTSRFLLAALFFLALGLAGDVYVVVVKVLGASGAATAASIGTLLLLWGLWYVLPLTRRARIRPKRRHATS